MDGEGLRPARKPRCPAKPDSSASTKTKARIQDVAKLRNVE